MWAGDQTAAKQRWSWILRDVLEACAGGKLLRDCTDGIQDLRISRWGHRSNTGRQGILWSTRGVIVRLGYWVVVEMYFCFAILAFIAGLGCSLTSRGEVVGGFQIFLSNCEVCDWSSSNRASSYQEVVTRERVSGASRPHLKFCLMPQHFLAAEQGYPVQKIHLNQWISLHNFFERWAAVMNGNSNGGSVILQGIVCCQRWMQQTIVKRCEGWSGGLGR